MAPARRCRRCCSRRTSALGRSGGLALTVMPAPGTDWEMPQPASGLSSTAAVTGVMKCGRIHSATATRATMKPTNVTAMAGSVRRNSSPVVAPSAKANSA